MSEEAKKTESEVEEVATKTGVVEDSSADADDKPRVSTGSLPKGRYIETIGRRKTAVARVRISESGRSALTINGKTLSEFFPLTSLQKIVEDSLKTANITQKFSITAKVNGGGITSQAESVRLGVARALVEYDLSLRNDLKKAGFLKRDPRIKERKKFGLKKARKAAQWSKR